MFLGRSSEATRRQAGNVSGPAVHHGNPRGSQRLPSTLPLLPRRGTEGCRGCRLVDVSPFAHRRLFWHWIDRLQTRPEWQIVHSPNRRPPLLRRHSAVSQSLHALISANKGSAEQQRKKRSPRHAADCEWWCLTSEPSEKPGLSTQASFDFSMSNRSQGKSGRRCARRHAMHDCERQKRFALLIISRKRMPNPNSKP